MTAPRTALVTGANQGLGRALVERLAAGMSAVDRVLLAGRRPEAVHAAAADIAASVPHGARVEPRVLDVRDRRAIDTLAADLGEVDIVFSNAAAEASPDAVDDLVAQWRAAVHAGQAVQQGWGSRLNIPSTVAQVAAVRAFAHRVRQGHPLADRHARTASGGHLSRGPLWTRLR